MKYRVCVVDDEVGVRESLWHLASSSSVFIIDDAYASAREALLWIPLNPPDVVLMDICMPEMSGIECARRLKSILPQMKIVMFTALMNREALLEALFAGASGYLIKGDDLSKLENEIARVMTNGATLSQDMVELVIESFHQWQRPVGGVNLTAREQGIISHWFEGLLDKEIADKLRIGTASVRTHTARLFKRLGVHSRAGAIRKILFLDIDV
ncbi:MAG: response regulator transcription factor [Candidatus Omnitrophica bacterium]|nr:response regulator transcription factor [Candidatus Omnitrophota bacterium]